MDNNRNKISPRFFLIPAISALILGLCTWLIYSYSQMILNEEKELHKIRTNQALLAYQKQQDRLHLEELLLAQASPVKTNPGDKPANKFRIGLSNKTHFQMDEVHVTISYLNDKGTTTGTETLVFRNLQSGNETFMELSGKTPAKQVRCRITSVRSTDLGL